MMTNGAIDLFGQFCAVGFGGKTSNKERNNTFYRWRGTHFKDQLAGSGLQFQKWKAISPLEVILDKVKDNIFTLDSRDYLEIPEVTYHEHYVKLTDEEYSEYMNLKTKLYCELDGELVAFDENQKFAKLQTICDGFVYDDDNTIRSEYSTKIDEVVDFVDRCVNENEQVLLFYAFREEKAWIEEKLKRLHIKFCDVKDHNFMHKWNSGDIDVLLAHPASAGHGLNLQHGGRILVWSTITYDFELFAQANARLARQGQKRAVQIHCFMAKDTLEKDKLKALREKESELNNFLELTKQ
jgi:SNF2 family DNA or RNA helicase